MMTDRGPVDRVLSANRYCVLGTADRAGRPWATPVFFAPLDSDRICWVSSPDSRHSRNIEDRPAIAITVFDSTVEVGRAEAAYFEADGGRARPDQTEAALRALNCRLPMGKGLSADDLQPQGELVIYVADLRHRYVLVRGGNLDHGNATDMTLEV